MSHALAEQAVYAVHAAPPPVLDTRHTPCTTTRPLLAEWWPTLNAKTNQAYTTR